MTPCQPRASSSPESELRLHETEDQYLGAWKYLNWIFYLAYN
jgi:hypothetical protein